MTKQFYGSYFDSLVKKFKQDSQSRFPGYMPQSGYLFVAKAGKKFIEHAPSGLPVKCSAFLYVKQVAPTGHESISTFKLQTFCPYGTAYPKALTGSTNKIIFSKLFCQFYKG